MSSGIVALMLGVSTFMGALGLMALLWGLKTGQFEDLTRFLDGARNETEEDLKDAVEMEKKREEALKKRKKSHQEGGYRPPD